MPTKQRLYSQDAAATVRPDRTAADAATWTPDNLSAPEISGGVVADDVTLDAREWAEVQVVVDFSDGSGGLVTGGSVDLVPLIATPSPLASGGRVWRALATISGLASSGISAAVPVNAHDVAFRISALTLSGAADVSVRVTGGKWAEERAR